MKYYLYNKCSIFGMGSNFITFLANEDEIHRYFSEEEIAKMLSESTTYSKYNDLVPVPENISVTEEKYRLGNRIFHVWNQYGDTRDIVVGDACFTKRMLDLSHEASGFCNYNRNTIIEFTGYDFKNVLEYTYCFGEAEFELQISRDRLEDMEKRIEKIKRESDPDKIDHSLLEQYERYVEEDKANIEKFSKPCDIRMDYKDFWFKGRIDHWNDDLWKKDFKEYSNDDFKNAVFRYPICPRDGVSEVVEHAEFLSKYKLDEIFLIGADVKSKFAIETGFEYAASRSLTGINVMKAISETFGYD